jgi:hypothetical protein
MSKDRPKREKKKPKAAKPDFSQNAFRIVKEATENKGPRIAPNRLAARVA